MDIVEKLADETCIKFEAHICLKFLNKIDNSLYAQKQRLYMFLNKTSHNFLQLSIPKQRVTPSLGKLGNLPLGKVMVKQLKLTKKQLDDHDRDEDFFDKHDRDEEPSIPIQIPPTLIHPPNFLIRKKSNPTMQSRMSEWKDEEGQLTLLVIEFFWLHPPIHSFS